MVVTGCALHDFGKIYDYEVDTETNAVEYIPHIALINHLPRGAMEVHAFAVANDLDLTELEHCILAHHQRMDWGSPTTPATAEAFIVALSDYVDGTVAGIGARIKELMEAGQDMGRIRMGTLSTVVSPKTRELDGLI
jgi:3'-5' exoribonuclease